MTTTVRTTLFWGEAVPALPDEQTQELLPPEGAESCPDGWVYGYKLLPNVDPSRSSPEFLEMFGKIVQSFAIIDLARYVGEPDHWAFVYLAVFNEKHGVFGFESGNTRIPGPEHLARLEQEIGAKGKPAWYPNIPGTIFPRTNSLDVVVRTWQPRAKDEQDSDSDSLPRSGFACSQRLRS
ncbi:hypothetical protein HMN09_01167400 [Mycena chlorophos]|uniref:Uncharacterized protein n=1 Tax=Mycena chlorophos TaxID=658473 RepID=A0A8H6S7L0_MYCCL|nr:hypothetical protein HMN09_01167400 [Mycena chlorophos]